MKFDRLEDKCTYYRSLTDYKLQPNSNVLVMVDGHSFSKKVKNKFKKPFDEDFINMMNETAAYVCENVQGCKFAYVQSDEITFLITDYDTPETDSFFGYRLCKLQSIIASLATSKFNQLAMALNLSKKSWKPHTNSGNEDTVYIDIVPGVLNSPLYEFDCKAWTVPNSNDVYAWYLWRQIDCVKNSKQQAAQAYLSYKELVGLHSEEQINKLKEVKGIDWNTDYDDGKKYGRFIYQDVIHHAKTLPNNEVIEFDRKEWASHYAFPLTDIGARIRFYELIPILSNGVL